MMESFTIDSCVKGHHTFKNIWTPRLGELVCRREPENIRDRYDVAVVKQNNYTVGDVPRMISATCSLFLDRGNNTITCIVTGHRCYSSDLPQGGLEVPCTLKFDS